LKSLAHRLRASVDELERTRLSGRFRGLDLTPVADIVPRRPIRVGGEVSRIVIAPRQGIPTLEVMLSDGTGAITAVFTGRRSIAGIEPGRAMVIEGVVVADRGGPTSRRVVFNPRYTLIPAVGE